VKLNDLGRMRDWQAAIPEFIFGKSCELNDQISDYLNCYGLDRCVAHAKIDYFLGFREVEGFQILHQYFKQEQEDDDTVFIIHGYTDHSGLFSKVINNLLEKGKAVLIIDLPEHGLS